MDVLVPITIMIIISANPLMMKNILWDDFKKQIKMYLTIFAIIGILNIAMIYRGEIKKIGYVFMSLSLATYVIPNLIIWMTTKDKSLKKLQLFFMLATLVIYVIVNLVIYLI